MSIVYHVYFSVLQYVVRSWLHTMDAVWCCLLEPYTLVVGPSRTITSMSWPISILGKVRVISQLNVQPKANRGPYPLGGLLNYYSLLWFFLVTWIYIAENCIAEERREGLYLGQSTRKVPQILKHIKNI